MPVPSALLPPHADRPPLVLPLIVACALFMENLDSTVVATALPAIAHSLGQSPLTLNVAMTCYLLSLALFIPASGWLADRFGARDVFAAAIAVFTLSSLLCGVAQNLPEMITARILQGMGGAMMTPVGRLVLLRTVPKHQLVQALSYVTIPALVGPAIGPLVGGFIATFSSWRWIFYINLPIGILGLVLALKLIPNARQPNPGLADIRGLLLSGFGLGAMALGLDNVGRGSLPGLVEIATAAISLACLWLFARHAKRSPNPAIDFTLLQLPTFRASILGGSLFRISIGGVPFHRDFAGDRILPFAAIHLHQCHRLFGHSPIAHEPGHEPVECSPAAFPQRRRGVGCSDASFAQPPPRHARPEAERLSSGLRRLGLPIAAVDPLLSRSCRQRRPRGQPLPTGRKIAAGPGPRSRKSKRSMRSLEPNALKRSVVGLWCMASFNAINTCFIFVTHN